MNDKKIAFITSVNNEEIYNESKFYIEQIDIPNEFEIEFIKITEAKSLFSAYNQGMKSSDAKYKVFIHQDVFIVNKRFLYDIIDLFKSSEDIGMIGVAGAKYIPQSGIWWECGKNFGKVADNHTGSMQILNFLEVKNKFEEVAAVDGLIMITQYDMHWREDIFDGWHFYDMSQSFEFKRKGFKIVVPKQNYIWCIHDCGVISLANDFEENRIKFLREYEREINELQIDMVSN